MEAVGDDNPSEAHLVAKQCFQDARRARSRLTTWFKPFVGYVGRHHELSTGIDGGLKRRQIERARFLFWIVDGRKRRVRVLVRIAVSWKVLSRRQEASFLGSFDICPD